MEESTGAQASVQDKHAVAGKGDSSDLREIFLHVGQIGSTHFFFHTVRCPQGLDEGQLATICAHLYNAMINEGMIRRDEGVYNFWLGGPILPVAVEHFLFKRIVYSEGSLIGALHSIMAADRSADGAMLAFAATLDDKGRPLKYETFELPHPERLLPPRNGLGLPEPTFATLRRSLSTKAIDYLDPPVAGYSAY